MASELFEPAVVHVVRGEAAVRPVHGELEVAVGDVGVPGGYGQAIERGVDARRPQVPRDDGVVLGVVGVRCRVDDGERDGLAALGEEAVAPLGVAGLGQDRLGRGRVGGGGVSHAGDRAAPGAEGRQREAGRVEHRVLQPCLALGRDGGAVDRRADRLPDGQLVGRPLVQVRQQAVGAAWCLPEVVVGRVGVHEVLLQAGDEVPGPVDLPGEQRGQRPGVGGVDGEEDLRDLDLRRLPVVGVLLQREALRGEGVQHVRARCRPGWRRRRSPGRRPCSRPPSARSPCRRSAPSWCTGRSGT